MNLKNRHLQNKDHSAISNDQLNAERSIKMLSPALFFVPELKKNRQSILKKHGGRKR